MLFSYDDGEPLPPSTDDIWISATQLPTATSSTPAFNFSFFGKQYTMVYPGANGIISFDQHASGSSCAWSTSVPPTGPPYSSTPYNYANAVYGIYEDINPSPTGCPGNNAIRRGVLGNYPCRAFVFNYDHIGEYSCCSQGDSMYNTYQTVLYEGTNIIDVYVKHRGCCTRWNGGRGVIGLQNKTSSQILTIPGMDFGTPTNPITWTADNRAFRFTPITPPVDDAELTWYENVVDDNHIISRHPQAKNHFIAVTPTESTKYISVYRFTNAAGAHFLIMDTTLVLCPLSDSTSVVERNTVFEVYPNPTHDVVYVKMLNVQKVPKRLVVMDLQGRPLFFVTAEEITRVDLSKLPAGVYILSIEGERRNSVKIVKQ